MTLKRYICVVNMKLNFKTIQPYRIWYEYLQTALNDKNYSKKVDKNYYKDWHLNLVKKLTFNKWIKTHENLFTETQQSEIKLFENKRTPNTILVEIPISLNVQQIQKQIGKAVKGKVAKSQAFQRFKIQSNRPLQTRTFDYFLWTYQFRQLNKYTNEEIWIKVDEKIKGRQKKVAKRVEQYLKTGKGIRSRALSGVSATKDDKSRAIIVSRNIKKAQNILQNVCKGIFPGNYSDH